jgi:alpha-glucoside transport system permease protein
MAGDYQAPAIMKLAGRKAWFYLLPAVIVLLVYVVYPSVRTGYLSFLNEDATALASTTCREGQPCWGIFENYRRAFAGSSVIFRNNGLWLILMVPGTTVLGLVIAVLVDRVRYESLAKAVIFLPMAISFVGASVIWGHMYYYKSEPPQIGLLNAIVTALGFKPVPWTTGNPITATIALIVVGIWMWTGFCMTILSAALKGVPEELLEAARIDGANEFQAFWRVTVPIILPTIIVVLTTMTINVLKIFDIVFVLAKGQPATQVIATRMYIEQFNRGNTGFSSALAVILILAVLPIGYINVRRFREQEKIR